MLYTSTRNNEIRVTAAQAIAQGISEEGGLFVPVELPHFSMDTVREMMEMSYIGQDRAAHLLDGLFRGGAELLRRGRLPGR